MNKPGIEINPQVLKRLEKELVIWLTTVSPAGMPEPNPVWFYWDGDCFVIYTPPSSAKFKNIARNSRVSLNLAGSEALGGDVVILRSLIQDMQGNIRLPQRNGDVRQRICSPSTVWKSGSSP